MANPEHVEILRQGVKVWNEWMEKHWRRELDFREADLSGAILFGANLSRADLRGADLDGAKLDETNLSHANLFNAKLSFAELRGAKLSGANLRVARLNSAGLSGADLRGAYLINADLRAAYLKDATLTHADLSGADFTKVILWNTSFGDVDLSQVEGLDTVRHLGPSSIGLDTIYKSGGNIPEKFLRGCGVPEDFITYMRSLVVQPIQFYSCFISYSHKDEDFARRLFSKMRDANLRVWYAPEEMRGGRKLHEQIYEAIHVHDKLLLVLSEHSLRSEWVATEMRRARKAEREENRRKLFPIRLVEFDAIAKWEHFDADSGKDLGVELREYFIPDFSNWKDHDAFEKAFARLLRDLKAEQAPEAKAGASKAGKKGGKK